MDSLQQNSNTNIILEIHLKIYEITNKIADYMESIEPGWKLNVENKIRQNLSHEEWMNLMNSISKYSIMTGKHWKIWNIYNPRSNQFLLP